MTSAPKYTERKRAAQTFDREKIFFMRNGEKVNVYDFIQENREDTEIMPTLLKYGCIDKMGMDTKKTYDEFLEIKDLRDIYQAQAKANELWYKLPIEVRKEFNNNAEEFMNNGEKWLKNKLAKENSTGTQPEQQPKENGEN